MAAESSLDTHTSQTRLHAASTLPEIAMASGSISGIGQTELPGSPTSALGSSLHATPMHFSQLTDHPIPLGRYWWLPRTLFEAFGLVAITAWVCACVIGFVLATSGIGFGFDVLEAVTYASWADAAFVAAFGIFTIAYVLDASYWIGIWVKIRTLLHLTSGLLLAAACIMANPEFEIAPLLVACFGLPFAVIFPRRLGMFRKMHLAQFLMFQAYGLVIVGVVVLVWFWAWVYAEGNRWPGQNNELRDDYNHRAECGCEPCSVDITQPGCCGRIECAIGFLMWSSPFFLALISLAWGCIFFGLARATATHSIVKALMKLGFWFTAFCGTAIWVSAGLAGTGIQLASAVGLFVFGVVALGTAAGCATLGWKAFRKVLQESTFEKNLSPGGSAVTWAKAFLISTGVPLLSGYVTLSFFNQLARRTPFFVMVKPLETKEERSLWITYLVRRQIATLSRWHWGAVLSHAVWGCLFFHILNLVSLRLLPTTVALLREEDSVLACVAFCFIAVAFLVVAPMLPALAIDIAAGVVLVPALQSRIDTPVVRIVVLVVAIVTGIRLVSIAILYWIVGSVLGHLAAFRAWMRTSSMLSKALHHALVHPRSPVWHRFLIGAFAPMWLLTVLMRLRGVGLRYLLVSLPFTAVVVTLPAVIAGKLLIAQDRSATLFVNAAVGAVNCVGTLLMLRILESRLLHRVEEISELNNDSVEMEHRKSQSQRLAVEYGLSHHWSSRTHMKNNRSGNPGLSLPRYVKAMLVLAAVLIIGSFWVEAFLSGYCFVSISFPDSISKKLPGSLLDGVLPTGWGAIGAAAFGVLLYVAYLAALDRHVTKALEGREVVNQYPSTELEQPVAQAKQDNAAPNRIGRLMAHFSKIGSNFSAMPKEKLHIGIITWNVGNANPFTTNAPLNDLFDFAKSPNIIVIGVQESWYKVKPDATVNDDDSDEGEHDSQQKPRHFPQQQSGGGRHFETKIAKYLLKKRNMVRVKSAQLVQMKMLVFATKSVRAHLADVRATSEATGFLSVYGNKGAVGISLTYWDTRIFFVSAHLAAHLHHLFDRNAHVAEILEGTRIHHHCLPEPLVSDYTFWMGDLNYRIDLDYAEGVAPLKLKPSSPEHLANFAKVDELAQANEFETLLEHDQLIRERQRGAVFAGFSESPITFAPTFKCKRMRDIPEGSNTPTVYSSQRVPSYCDRVMWLTQPAFKNLVEPKAYCSVPTVGSSDHKPVRAEFVIKVLPEPVRESFPDNDQLLLSDVRVLRTSNSAAQPMTTRESDAEVRDDAKSGLTLAIFSYPSHLISERVTRTSTISPTVARSTGVVANWASSLALRLKTGRGKLDKMHAILHVEKRDIAKTETIGIATLNLADVVMQPDAQFDFSIPLRKNFVDSGLVIEGHARIVHQGDPGWEQPGFA
eukprot:c19200_g1_i3.p1 GENE.c19200_g1_i3~~c19200_g1_i3.p1  ORF type:complete len:1426 (+),score=291.77 c19200_g1_i3:84-4280(+)